MINFHESMQLGESHLTENWDDTTPEWNWGNNHDWMANRVEVVSEDENIPFLESVKLYEGHEFQILKMKIKNKDFNIRLEVKDFVGKADGIVFPANSQRKKPDEWFPIAIE